MNSDSMHPPMHATELGHEPPLHDLEGGAAYLRHSSMVTASAVTDTGAAVAVNREEIRRFLNFLHTHAAKAFEGATRTGRLQLTRLHPDTGTLTVSGRFVIGDVVGMTDAAVADARAGHNVYVEARTVTETLAGNKRGEAIDTVGVFALVVDSDADKDKSAITVAVPSLSVESSPGNAHLWYFFEEAISVEAARTLGQAMRSVGGGDADTGNPVQPYRVAGTPNYPDARKRARGRAACNTSILTMGNAYAHAALELTFKATAPAASNPCSSSPAAALLGRCSDIRLRQLSVTGAELRAVNKDRSGHFFKLVGFLKGDGFSADEIFLLMTAFPLAASAEKYGTGERLAKCIADAYGKVEEVRGQFGYGEEANLVSCPGGTWDGDVAETLVMRWTVKGVLPANGTALLAAEFAFGKSFVAMELARCVMTGEPFAGRTVKKLGGVLWFAAEAEGEMQHRLEALRKASRVPLAPLPFKWYGPSEFPLLLSSDAETKLRRLVGQSVAEMRDRFDAELALIVVDTMAAASGFKDENDAAEAQRAMRMLDTLGREADCLALGIDHYGKVAENGVRGSSAKEAAADATLVIGGHRDAQTGVITGRTLSQRKQRGGSVGGIAAFELRIVDLGQDEDGDAMTSCVVDWSTERVSERKARRPSANLTLFFATLNDATINFGAAVRPFGVSGPEVRAVPFAQFRQEYIDRATVDKERDSAAKAFNRHMKVAVDQQLIVRHSIDGHDWVWKP